MVTNQKKKCWIPQLLINLMDIFLKTQISTKKTSTIWQYCISQLVCKIVKIKKNPLLTDKFPHVNLSVPVNVSKLEDCLNLGETS